MKASIISLLSLLNAVLKMAFIVNYYIECVFYEYSLNFIQTFYIWNTYNNLRISYIHVLLRVFTKCITKRINSLNLYHLVLNVEQRCGLNLS